MADLAHASENDTDLHGDTDAAHWAERFVHHVTANPAIATSEGSMLAWFAGAIETGKMTAVQLTPAQARYLSILAAEDLRADEQRGRTAGNSAVIRDIHDPAWEALQPACQWEELPPE